MWTTGTQLRTNILKMTVLSKVVYGFNATPIRIPMIFIEIVKKSKIHMESQKTQNSQILRGGGEK
jgi:hypothetical protein